MLSATVAMPTTTCPLSVLGGVDGQPSVEFDFDGVLADFWPVCCIDAHIIAARMGYEGSLREFIQLGWGAPRAAVAAAVPLVDYADVAPLEAGVAALRWALDTYGPHRVGVLTRCPPSLAHHYAQKRAWLDEHGLADAHITAVTDKPRWAAADRLLLDDCPRTIAAWREAGAPAHQVPTPWTPVGPRAVWWLADYQRAITPHMGAA